MPTPFGAFAGGPTASFGSAFGSGSGAGTPVTSQPLFGGLAAAPQVPSLKETEASAEKDEEELQAEEEQND